MDTAFDEIGFGPYRFAPLQLRSELAEATEYLQSRAPSSMMEIGTAAGGTFYVWGRALESVDRIISLDLPSNEPAWIKDQAFIAQLVPDKRVSFIRGNSHTDGTVAEIGNVVPDGGIDFLFIDADHSYDGVAQDFETYQQFVSDDGIIGFHDIVSYSEKYQVDKFWSELKAEYPVVEFVDERYGPEDVITINGVRMEGHGIGFIRNEVLP